MKGVAIVCLGPAGLATARTLQRALPEAQLHGLEGRVDDADVIFAETAEHLRALFEAGQPVLGVCAAGILIRALAPLLADKRAESPVVAVAADGSAAVPLLGGHHGANDLARAAGSALGGAAAITTAGDLRLGIALDEPPPGWRLANPEAAKAITAALLSGESVALKAEAGDPDWLTASRATFTEPAPLSIRLTVEAARVRDGELVIHPAVLALGVGCERDTPPEELIALVDDTLAAQGLARDAIACVASLDVKADETAVLALAESLGVPARFFDAATLEAETPRLETPSRTVFAAVGCHGVAEGAALAAGGARAHLIVAKQKSKRATCAIAQSPDIIDAAAVGRARGRLAIIGIGPGADDWRSPEASRLIAEAGDLVGYGLYFDLLGPLADGKTRHSFELGDEETRVRAALDLAARGRNVALICSGDAGIYAMASPLFELLEHEGDPAWKRIQITVATGISALQAAAARAGAPLGHDFCAISLSDLLTPWAVIERRLQAAAEGDFVVALYNPVSKRRREALPKARDILLAHRPAETPVIIARNLGRPGEAVRRIELAALETDDVDMLTVLIVGSSQTRAMDDWVYTPRGYKDKAKP